MQCDSESNKHPMHRLFASEFTGDFNRLKIEAVLLIINT